jgi:hypothetical protein
MGVKMAKYFLDGNGLLSGELDFEEMARRREEERKEEQAAAAQAAEEAAAQEKASTLLGQIEEALTKGLGAEIAAEIADQKQQLPARTRAQYRDAFQRFREYCRHWETPLPALPASPAVVAAFLTSELRHGPAHVRRLAKSITHAHRVAELKDPCSDLLVRATIRLSDSPEKTDQPSQPEGS